MNENVPIALANCDLGEEWHCEWEGCEVGGKLRQRTGPAYFRHDCHHTPEFTFDRTVYICAHHYAEFQRAHGMGDTRRRILAGATPGMDRPPVSYAS